VNSRQPHKTAVVLLHHPVTNREGALVTTAVTNMDIHDISRSVRTYEVDHYYLVTPVLEQQSLTRRILTHWAGGRCLEWHPDRAEALSRARCVSTFEEVKTELIEMYPGRSLEVAMPDAREIPGQKTYAEVRAAWEQERNAGIKVLVLGTGWGLSPAFHSEVHTFLGPIYGPLGREGYNHLSVRAAAAVILDRLFGAL
jgi:hypothetical protein